MPLRFQILGNLCFCLKVRNHIRHSYKTGKICFHILILCVLYIDFNEECNPPFPTLTKRSGCCLAMLYPPDVLLNTWGSYFLAAQLSSFTCLCHLIYFPMVRCHNKKNIMLKSTLELQIFLHDNYVKKKSYSCVKEGFIISILVFMFSIHQRFSDQ